MPMYESMMLSDNSSGYGFSFGTILICSILSRGSWVGPHCLYWKIATILKNRLNIKICYPNCRASVIENSPGLQKYFIREIVNPVFIPKWTL